MQPLEINQKRNPARNRREEKQQRDGFYWMRLRGLRPQRRGLQFAARQKNQRHAHESDDNAHAGGQSQWHAHHYTASGDGGKTPKQRTDERVGGTHIETSAFE